MTGPRWIDNSALVLLHAESLAEHGGLEGMRDEGLLDSALARHRNVYAYEGADDPGRLAASYAFGIARNHPFADGNKRAAFLAIGLFLAMNGWRLAADKEDATRTMLALAEGSLSEELLADWIRRNSSQR
jgi:death-on-curing protein